MDHSFGNVDNDADEAVAATMEKVLSAKVGAQSTINQSQFGFIKCDMWGTTWFYSGPKIIYTIYI